MARAGKFRLNELLNGGVGALTSLWEEVKPGAGGGGSDGDVARWRTVTVNKPLGEVHVDQLESLTRLGDMVEITTCKAPGDKGTEIAARLRDPEPSGLESLSKRLSGDDPRQAVRSALREAKQLLETGEILQANDNKTTKETLRGKPLDMATARAGGEGRL